MKIVSACLVGIACRWDGKSKPCQKVVELFQRGEVIPVCPEQFGGLSTPRAPSEKQVDGSVQTNTGIDVTQNFVRGAQQVLELAKLLGCTEAILKSKSPSCGSGKIYDGTFSNTLIDGDGICATLLKDNDIKVITEEDL